MHRFDLETYARKMQQTARTLLQDSPPDQSKGDVARAIQELAEIALAKHQINREAIACRAGCGHCCIVNVAVLPPEIDAIVDDLDRKITPNEKRQLSLRAEKLFHQVHGLNDEERILLRRSCLFLDEAGKCEIYPVRPLLCRALTSTDPDRCREALAMVALGEEIRILSNTFQQELFTRAFTELGDSLEWLGMDGRSRPLTGAIRERIAALGWSGTGRANQIAPI